MTKVFAGEDFEALLALARRFFARASAFDPDATRKESKETFIVANNPRHRAALEPAQGLAALLALPLEEA